VQGSCAGTCDGSCDASAAGTCQGTCSGSCAGSCTGEVKTSCDGSCAGECTGKLARASCSGKLKPPKRDSSCYGSCTAQAATGPQCGAASADVTLVGGNSRHLEAALKENLAGVIQVATQGPALGVEQVEALLSTGAKLKNDLGSVGGEGLACVTSALAIAAATGVSMGHSVDATLEFKGSVSGNFGL
jgi:modification target Cys-rich repeat protein